MLYDALPNIKIEVFITITPFGMGNHKPAKHVLPPRGIGGLNVLKSSVDFNFINEMICP